MVKQLKVKGKVLKLLRNVYRKESKEQPARGCILGVMAKQARIKLPSLKFNGEFIHSLKTFANKLCKAYEMDIEDLVHLQELNDNSSEYFFEDYLKRIGLISNNVTVELHD